MQPEDAEGGAQPEVKFSSGDVVALKHNYKRYLEPFFLAILIDDLHSDEHGFIQKTVNMKWLEQSEEDPLVYTVGNHDNRNSPKCIMTRVEIIREDEKFLLSRVEERRLVGLASGALESDSSDSDRELSEAEDMPEQDQARRHVAGHSRSGRRVTRFAL